MTIIRIAVKEFKVGYHNMGCRLNSLKGVVWRITQGPTKGVIKGDTRSLDYGSYVYMIKKIGFHEYGNSF